MCVLRNHFLFKVSTNLEFLFSECKNRIFQNECAISARPSAINKSATGQLKLSPEICRGSLTNQCTLKTVKVRLDIFHRIEILKFDKDSHALDFGLLIIWSLSSC